MSQVAPPLSQGVGYGVVIGVGLAFAAGKVVNLRPVRKILNQQRNDGGHQSIEEDTW